MIVLTKRQFQWTIGFWFAFATVNGFCGGFSAHALGQLLGRWR